MATSSAAQAKRKERPAGGPLPSASVAAPGSSEDALLRAFSGQPHLWITKAGGAFTENPGRGARRYDNPYYKPVNDK